MAKFQIKLLTPIFISSHSATSTDKASFLETLIGDFETKTYKDNDELAQNHEFSYTFNEKFSIHLNAQKDLTFSMMRYQWIDDIYETNPFVQKIHIGSQILLIDSFNNEYIFTVKNIDYVMGRENITYNYTCQDSFTYQLIRQNSGYTISNNIESEDFIGAHTVDWWVKNKIQPECHIAYEYIPLEVGLYLGVDGNVYQYTNISDITNKVDKIIKIPFSKNNDKELFELLPFSISGSNASAALIALGDILGLMLKTIECNIHQKDKLRSNEFTTCFWYEPQKNTNTTGLRYSPYSSVQDFGLSHRGDSITTILNVESTTINDEVISLIPTVPLFFSEYIQNSEIWNRTTYSKGWFSSVCKEQIFYGAKGSGSLIYNSFISTDVNFDSSFIQTGDGEYNGCYIKLNDFTIPWYYDTISFIGSKIQFENNSDLFCTPRNFKWGLSVRVEKINTETNQTETSHNIYYEDIPSEIWGLKTSPNTQIHIFIKDMIASGSLINDEMKISFLRQPSDDEIIFAQAADECPWLENKLIDFSYFLDQKIITPNEYSQLIKNFNDNLRILNGKILLYSKSYYEAIHRKTEILSKIQNRIDDTIASFHSDVVQTYADKGGVSDIKSFTDNYQLLQALYSGDVAMVVGLPNVLTDYANKYFKTKQRFLKNMYEFKKYFESPVGLGSLALYDVNITMSIPSKTDEDEFHRYLSFSSWKWNQINSDFNLINSSGEPLVDIYDSTKLTKITPVTPSNFKQYFVVNSLVELVEATESTPFVRGIQYYKNDRTPITTKEIYERYIKNLHDQGQIPSGWCYHNENTKSNTSQWIPNESKFVEIFGDFNLSLFESSFTKQDIESGEWDDIYDNLDKGKIDRNNQAVCWKFYRTHFPIQTIEYYGPHYIESEYITDGFEWTYQPVNKNGNTIQEYCDYLKKYKGNEPDQDSEDYMVNPFDTSQYRTFYIPLATTSNYQKLYRRTGAKHQFRQYGRNNRSFLNFKLEKPSRKFIDITQADMSNYSSETWINYTNLPDAYDKYIKFRDQGSVPIGVKYDSGSDKITYNTIDSDYPLNYFNWFSLVAPTYSYLANFNIPEVGSDLTDYTTESTIMTNATLTYTDGFLEPLSINQKTSELKKYRILILKEQTFDFDANTNSWKENEDENIEIIDPQSMPQTNISKIIYYPIYNCTELINNNVFNFAEVTNIKALVESYFNKKESTTEWQVVKDNSDPDNVYILQKYSGATQRIEKRFMVFEEQNYISTKITSYTGEVIYDDDSAIEVQLSQQPGLVAGLYYEPEDIDNLTTPSGEFNENLSFYQLTDDGYKRAYTIKQIMDDNTYYYQDNSDSWSGQSLNTTESLSIQVYAHEEKYIKDSDGKFTILVDKKIYPILNHQQFHINPDKIISETISLEYNNNLYTSVYSSSLQSASEDFKNLNKGQFWYKYKDYTSQKYLMNEALVIETQLESYWQQAYVASKYCEYFIPESWHKSTLGASSNFTSWVIVEDGSLIYLNPLIVPSVEINKNQKYIYSFKNASDFTDVDGLDIINIEQNSVYDLALKELNADSNQFYLIKGLAGNIYEHKYGGTKWNQLLYSINPSLGNYPEISGQYIMMYNFLSRLCINEDFSVYTQVKKERDNFWTLMRCQYPYILLEDNFSSSDATTSSELLLLAKYAMKDKTRPERDYRITYINSSALDGYVDSELKIGDGILIDASEYYDEIDNVTSSLSQYLFITDISYDLRKDSDIQLTVNSIKYQDKLIQRLAKLIK